MFFQFNKEQVILETFSTREIKELKSLEGTEVNCVKYEFKFTIKTFQRKWVYYVVLEWSQTC